MTIHAFLGSALPYAFGLLIIGGVAFYFNAYLPWRNRRRASKRWDIHVE